MTTGSRITNLVRGMRDSPMRLMPVLMVALFAGAVYAFLAIADEVSENEIAEIDNFLFMLFRNPGNPAEPLGPAWFRETMTEITSLGGYPVLVILVGSVIGFLVVVGKFGPALFVSLSMISGTAVGHALKLIYDRPRPDLVEPLVNTHTASFPSGHATMSAIVYLTLASLIMRLVDETATRAYVLTVALLLTLAIGLSRIYLGVHLPSDVAAGWALGVAWASLSWLIVSALRRLREGGDRRL